jgi:hypothetical protein
MSENKYEIFLPVIFIISFLLFLFVIYALVNLEIGTKLGNYFYSICSCFCPNYESKRIKKQSERNRKRNQSNVFTHKYNSNPYSKNDDIHNYYEGPTNGFYRIGSRMNYYSQHFSHFHPAPHMMHANSIKINTIYKSSEDGSTFALPTAQLTSSTPPLATTTAQQQQLNADTLYRSYDSASFESQPQQGVSQFHKNYAGKTNTDNINGNNNNKVLYFNNISWWPSKIMSEHELRKFINYNYYFDANNVNNVSNIASSFRQTCENNAVNKTTSMNNDNNNLSNLVYLRQNFSDLGLMMNSKSQQHLMVKKQTTGGKNFMNANRLRQKIFSTSSNLFSIGCSSYRLSSTTEYNYNRHVFFYLKLNIVIKSKLVFLCSSFS